VFIQDAGALWTHLSCTVYLQTAWCKQHVELGPRLVIETIF